MIVLCAVCESEIEEDEALVLDFQGGHYFLCSDPCLREIQANPESYAEEDIFEEVY